MNPVISPCVFYWIEIVDKARELIGVAIIFSFFIVAACMIFREMAYDVEEKYHLKAMAKKAGIVLAISIPLFTFTPTSDTCYKMLAANMFTKDNIDSASEYVTDVIDYAVDKIKELQPATNEEK